jgi:predicted  nucleic acid-binding Zn ribbon protein
MTIAKKIIKKIIHSRYISKSFREDWIITSYLSDVFYKKQDIKYMSSNQNKIESIIINQLFNEMEFNNIVLDYKIPFYLSKTKKISIVFGLEPNFIKLIKKFPNSVKVYYATGAYYKF